MAVKNYFDDNTPNAHVYIAAYPKENPCIVSDYGVTELITKADLAYTAIIDRSHNVAWMGDKDRNMIFAVDKTSKSLVVTFTDGSTVKFTGV